MLTKPGTKEHPGTFEEHWRDIFDTRLKFWTLISGFDSLHVVDSKGTEQVCQLDIHRADANAQRCKRVGTTH